MSLNRSTNFIVLVVGLGALASTAVADVELASPFQDHMVLQRDQAIPVWGWADAGERVTVKFRGQDVETVAGADGSWQVELSPVSAGGPDELSVTGRNQLQLTDVLVGEVWLASGQSNMAMQVSRALNLDHEKARADLPHIRMLTVSRKPSPEPLDRCSGEWVVCSPETVSGFSATAYFFARELHAELNVPIGILNSSYGGTAVEAWTSRAAQDHVAAIKPVLEPWDTAVEKFDPEAAEAAWQKQLAGWTKRAEQARAAGKPAPRKPRKPASPEIDQNRPANLFNGMIHPLIPYAIRGAIWYQGERNTRAFPQLYSVQLETLIADWRKRWHRPEMPFAWAQLPNFTAVQTDPVQTTGWVIVQEQMLKTLRVPGTGMAITIDVGEANDIHPRNKQEVGRRLSLWALNRVYGRELVDSGPIMNQVKLVNRDGQPRLLVEFHHTAEGLKTADGEALRGFAIAGEDQKFLWGEAVIEGNAVHVWHPDIKTPVAVRYDWAPNPIGNLVNSAGLPAAPGRSDNWPLKPE